MLVYNRAGEADQFRISGHMICVRAIHCGGRAAPIHLFFLLTDLSRLLPTVK